MATSTLLLLLMGVIHVWADTSSVCLADLNDLTDLNDCFHFKKLGCTCGCQPYGSDRKQAFVVNCTNRGFTNTLMLKDLPAATEVLIFSGNNIRQLPWNVLGNDKDYINLKEVDMSNNNINEILGKSYHKVSSVTRLILNHNDLRISDGFGDDNKHHPRVFSNFVNLRELHLTNAFADNSPENLAEDLHDIFYQSNLSQLIKLHLEQNEIRTFKDPGIFCNLPKLMDVHLGNNELEHLDFDVSCLKQLRFIDLEANKIAKLNLKDLVAMDTLPRRNQTLMVDLTNNPINCDCNIRDFVAWLGSTKVTVRNGDMLKCGQGYPYDNIGKRILDVHDFQCLPPKRYSEALHASSTTIPVLIAFLVCLFVLLVGTLLYMNKSHLKHQLTPILDSVSRKVQYTSIGKQDQEMDV
ncbi:hypothetical protein R5R35_011427 [Gryllus longicercus]